MKKPRRAALKTLGALAIGALVSPFLKLQTKALSTINTKLAKKLPIQAILIGAGNRGNLFGKYALSHSHQLQIVGITDLKNPSRAKLFAKAHDIAAANCTKKIKDLFDKPKFADVVILTEHAYSPSLAISALKAGYEVWMDQAFVSISAEREVDAIAQQSEGSVKVMHMITKEILPDHTQIEKQKVFSSAFQAGNYPYFMVMG